MNKRFTEEQIIGFLRKAEAGTPVQTEINWPDLEIDVLSVPKTERAR
ncbi:hypothetical protein N8I74_02035 [Chitiniphilus purpureus]|uniref:Uncharacterized protein n=1 Tax=Chitiniphilus purpureus TaxID=2981137 RepID=A0ABY6DN58_9NEIS|nr:hypothetical protein [Chitiniphilus sp. CD1]UXY15819.1 hypothetical protein N8I74_02035 [Chitiniphilus sp. CD1]